MTPGNPADVTIVVKELWQLTGKRDHPGEKRPLSEWTGIPRGVAPSRYLVLVEWDARLSYLKRVDVKLDPQPDDYGRFTSVPQDARDLFERYGWPENRMPESVRVTDLDTPSLHFIVGEVCPVGNTNRGSGSESTLTVFVSVDTDDRGFRQYGDAVAKGGALPSLPPELTVTSYFPPSQSGSQKTKTEGYRRVRLQLTPAKKMEPFKGYVALDLGNTNSSLAFMAREDPDPDRIRVVGDYARKTGGGSENPAGVTPTAVRIRGVDAAPAPANAAPGRPAPGSPLPSADYLIGDEAGPTSTTLAGNLILGAKRLLAAPPNAADPGHMVWVDGQQRTIPRQLPAELFVAGMLRRFHALEQQGVERLAVTCPTTFTDREIEQLKETVFRAWGRALGFSSTPPADQARAIREKLIPLVIDEASAAAFFFLYRDFIRAAGGTRGVRYQYPHGVNLLLYDCGGGTTDLALVRVRTATPEEMKSGRAFSHMYIDVLGRTGMRGFGGDNITQAVFRLLKAKIAALRGNVPHPPDELANLRGFLDDEENQARFDEIIPTKIRLSSNPAKIRPDLSQDEIRGRQDRHLDLWNLAEGVKIQLASSKELSEVKLTPSQDASYLEHLAQEWRCSQQEVFDDLNKVVVTRAELDELIRPDVRESVEKANHLIASRLKGGEVHRVYVVGNASRYPLIQETLRAHLRVRFIDPVPEGSNGTDWGFDRLVLDTKNFKHAVAKGAVVALRLRARAEGLDVGYDPDLIHRLPYHIGYLDLSRGVDCLPVYREHEKYPDLKPVPIPVPRTDATTRGRPGCEFALYRLWPGEARWEHFIDFAFEHPVDGPLQLRHEANPPRFLVRDDGKSRQETVGTERPFADYVSPAQQGLY